MIEGRMISTYQSLNREDPKKRATSGRRAGWYVGGNSTCRRHIVSLHYGVYVARCKEGGIKETEQATPKKVWAAKITKETKEKERKKATGGAQLQLTLDSVVQKVETPTAFSRTAILDAVTQHVVCGDQVCVTPSISHGSVYLTTALALPTFTVGPVVSTV